jgi:membrane protease YdiL (CAAX protease family)
MSDSDLDSVSTVWEWKLSLEMALYTTILNAVVSILISLILVSNSDQLRFQILGSPSGTAILGASEVLLVVPLFIYTGKLGISRDQLGIHIGSRTQVMADTAIGVIIGVTMVPTSLIVSTLNEAILGPQPQADYIRAAFNAGSWLELILLLLSVIVVVAPVEEIIIRGFIQQGFERSFGGTKGLIAASLVFAVMHLSLWSILPLTILGAMLGLCFRIRHGRILAPIVSHALYMVCLIVSVPY